MTMMRKSILWVGGLLLFVLVMDSFVMPIFVRKGQEFPLPDVTALTTKEAREAIENLGLELHIVGSEDSPARLEGTVLAEIRDEGIEVAGVTVRQASLSLSDLGLVSGDVRWVFSDSLPPEVVTATDPGAGALVPKGSHVTLYVNQGSGQDTLAMPNLVGTTLQDAADLLQKLGLELGVAIRQHAADLVPGIDLVVAAREGEA